MDKLYNQIAFKTSKNITKTYSTSFYSAVSMLAPELRASIHSIYGFVRIADEIVDSFHNTNQKYLLDKLESDLSEALKMGVSTNPVLHSFAQTVKKFNIDHAHIEAFMKSMRADLSKTVYHNNNETSEYIYGSAEVVGLMCLKVFVEGNQEKYDELLMPAMKLGSAFQKVNFLRDLKADVEDLNRTYFSGFDKNHFDEEMKKELINEIDTEFKEAKKGISKLPNTSKIAVWLAYLYYMALLRKLKKTPARKIISTRIRVNNFAKLGIYFKAYASYKLNLV
jgi:phytoene synthase